MYLEPRWLAAWVTLNGQSQVSNQVRYTAVFGDSAARATETDVIAQAPIAMNVTNLRVASSVANCGDLQSGESIAVTLRVNAAASALTGSCAFGAAQNSFTLDTDTVEIQAGDRLSFSMVLTGALLTRNPRLSITMEGWRNESYTIPAVENMTVEIQGLAPFLHIVKLAAFTGAVLLGWRTGNILITLGGVFGVFHFMGEDYGWASIVPLNLAMSLILLGALLQAVMEMYPTLMQRMRRNQTRT